MAIENLSMNLQTTIERGHAAAKAGTVEGYTEAADCFTQAAALEVQDAKGASLYRANAHSCESLKLAAQGLYDEAAIERQAAAKIWESAGEHDDAQMANAFIFFYQGSAAALKGDLEAANAFREKAIPIFRQFGEATQADLVEGCMEDAKARLAGADLETALLHREAAQRLLAAGGDLPAANLQKAAAADLKARRAEAKENYQESLQHRYEAARHWTQVGQLDDAVLEEAFANDLQARLAYNEHQLKAAISYRRVAARLFEQVEGSESQNRFLELGFAEDLEAQLAQDAQQWETALDHRLKSAEWFEKVGRQSQASIELAFAENARMNILIAKESNAHTFKVASAHAWKATDLCKQAGHDNERYMFEGAAYNMEARSQNALGDIKGAAELMRKSADAWRKGGNLELAAQQDEQAKLAEQKLAEQKDSQSASGSWKKAGIKGWFR